MTGGVAVADLPPLLVFDRPLVAPDLLDDPPLLPLGSKRLRSATLSLPWGCLRELAGAAIGPELLDEGTNAGGWTIDLTLLAESCGEGNDG